MINGVQLPSKVPIALHPFTDYFKGFERVDAVRSIFGPSTEKVLESLKVEFLISKLVYMGFIYEDVQLIVISYYLR